MHRAACVWLAAAAAVVASAWASTGPPQQRLNISLVYPLEPVLVVVPFLCGHLLPLVRLARELASVGHPVTLITHLAAVDTVAAVAPNVHVSGAGGSPMGAGWCVRVAAVAAGREGGCGCEVGADGDRQLAPASERRASSLHMPCHKCTVGLNATYWGCSARSGSCGRCVCGCMNCPHDHCCPWVHPYRTPLYP
jgi:hypothetical protein